MSALPQPPQDATVWVPQTAGLMQWAEQTYPQLFPAGPPDRTWSVFTYRRYPQTGNILAVAGEGVYVAGPVSGGPGLLVGRLSDFSCSINPAGCAPEPVLSLPPVSTTPIVRPTNVLAGVTAVLRSPQRIDAQLTPGQQMNTVTLLGSVNGNLQLLAGRTLYVLVEDPHALFSNPPGVSVGSTSISVYLNNNSLTTVGVREGNLKIYACVDYGCSTQLSGSPMLLPYRVSVVSDVAMDPASVSLQADFGEVPSPRAVRVTLPLRTSAWGVRWAGGSLRATATSSNQLGNTVGTVTFSARPDVPGSYGDTFEVYGDAGDATTGGSRRFSKNILVDYRVRDNPALNAAVYPAQTRVAVTQGDSQSVQVAGRYVVAKQGITVTSRGVEYLSWPSEATSAQRRFGWWSEATTSASPCNLTDCLPPGTYSARTVYSVASGTGTTTLYHPVSMQVYP